MNRNGVLARLARSNGGIIGMTLGSGINYNYAEANGLDMALLISAGKFRQMGFPSLAGSMPYLNANEIIWELAVHEVLPQRPKIPIILGVCATDPTIDLEAYICKAKEYGLSGICNMPSVIIVDGKLRSAMEADFGFELSAQEYARLYIWML